MVRRGRPEDAGRFTGLGSALVAAGALLVTPRVAHAQQGADRAAAQALYDEAKALAAEGSYADACPKFEESQRLDAGLGTQFFLADCWEHVGRTASAWALYLEVAMGSKAAGRLDRAQVASERAAALEPKLSKIAILVNGPAAIAGLEVRRDGAPVSAALYGSLVPIDPGEHVVRASAPGKKTWETRVTVAADGALQSVEVPVLEDAPAEPAAPAAATPGAAGAAAPADQGGGAPAPSLAHTGQIGAVLRADVDGRLRGAVTAVGATYGALSFLDVSLVALIGGSQGFEPSVTVLPLAGEIKPRLSLGAPVFFIEGARVGFRGAVGVEWDPSAAFGVFAEVGAAAFPALPSGYDKVVLVPTLGVSARL